MCMHMRGVQGGDGALEALAVPIVWETGTLPRLPARMGKGNALQRHERSLAGLPELSCLAATGHGRAEAMRNAWLHLPGLS